MRCRTQRFTFAVANQTLMKKLFDREKNRFLVILVVIIMKMQRQYLYVVRVHMISE